MAASNVEEPLVALDELEVKKLRDRWELASVLNFLSVFEPMIGGDLKMTAEEIEEGLINPNNKLAQLHVTLLKAIPPVNINLKSSDAWITAVCKKLALWWPWVSEGEIPLQVAKGEEIRRYKEIDPTSRLLILKALCETRADQNDAVSYVNDALKNGTQLCCFRKDRIAEDGDGTSYWYDGNMTIGHRLYREVFKPESGTESKDIVCFPAGSYNWETLATNLGEFRKVAEQLSYSSVPADVTVCNLVETNAIPLLEKDEKKKERALKRKQRVGMPLVASRNSSVTRITRSCRDKPINYTYDDYDKTITIALRHSEKSRASGESSPKRNRDKQGRTPKSASTTESIDMDEDLKSCFGDNDSSTDSDMLEEVADDDDGNNNVKMGGSTESDDDFTESVGRNL